MEREIAANRSKHGPLFHLYHMIPIGLNEVKKTWESISQFLEKGITPAKEKDYSHNHQNDDYDK